MGAVYRPIVAVRTLNGVGFPAQQRVSEGASKTFKQGVPLVFSSGVVQEAAFGGAEIVCGVSVEPAHNLTNAGTAEPAYSEGTPQNQTGKIIPVGAWNRDGTCGMYLANGSNVFMASVKVGQTYADSLISGGTTFYGLTKDATTGFWYVDTADTAGDNAVVEIIGGVSDDATLVLFIFKAALRYYA